MKHPKIDRDVLPLCCALALLVLGLWMRSPVLSYEGPPTQDDFNSYALERFGSYSDIASLYFRDGLAERPRPYFDYSLEYPVGTGLVIYLFNAAAHSMPQYFLLTSLFMTLCALTIVELVPRFPSGRAWLVALSPALALYVNLNWDMWGALLMVVSLLLFVREHDGLGAAVLAAAVWTKFFPILFLPFLVVDRLRRRGKRAVWRIIVIFALASAAINAPVLLLAPTEWWHFFAYNAERGSEWNLWTFFDPSWLSTDEINNASAMLLLWGLAVLILVQRRTPPGAWLPACCAMLAWFFFVNKVWSPQYGLWVVVLLAVVGAAPAVAVAWSAADLFYFAAGFTWLWLGLSHSGAVQQWFVDQALLPTTALREGMLLVVIGWCIHRMSTPERDSAQGGEHPGGSSANIA